MLEITKVSKVYGKDENAFFALNEVDLKIKKSEVVAIVGKSGSGKSTLLHIMIGLDKVTTGEVYFNSKKLPKRRVDSWRGDNVGIVFQQFFLQPQNSVLDNVALPLKIAGVPKTQRRIRAMDALVEVDMLDKARSKANDLSGGQKQRVAIARAIVSKPEIVVTDEPTGNLDSENGYLVTKLLFDLNKTLKTTLIIVTHDEELAEQCDRVIRIKDGKIIADTPGNRSKRAIKYWPKTTTKRAQKTKKSTKAKRAVKPKVVLKKATKPKQTVKPKTTLQKSSSAAQVKSVKIKPSTNKTKTVKTSTKPKAKPKPTSKPTNSVKTASKPRSTKKKTKASKAKGASKPTRALRATKAKQAQAKKVTKQPVKTIKTKQKPSPRKRATK